MFGKKGYDSRAVANYFVERSRADERLLSVSQVIKLVFLAHGWHLGFKGKPLIYHRIEAWKYGPVIPEVYDAFRYQLFAVRYPASVGEEPYKEDFDDYAIKIMGHVYDAYSKIPAVALSKLTHKKGTPWSLASKEGGHFARISDKRIENYYKRLIAHGRKRDNREQGLER